MKRVALAIFTALASLAMVAAASAAQHLSREELAAYYYETEWGDLTPSEREAWGVLGWTEELWEASSPGDYPETEYMMWDDLTADQQAAMLGLGYDRELWDEDIVRTTDGDLEEFWNSFAWDDLNLAERALWDFLGWNEGNWDGDDPEPDSEEKDWADLTGPERDAAMLFGYDEEVWNAN